MEEVVKYEPDRRVQLGTVYVDSPAAVITQATEMAQALARLIKDRKLYSNIRGKEYVRVEGWSTLGAMLGVLPREVVATEHDNGDFEAVVELVRTSDQAIIGRGSAIVGADEPTWASRPRYARRSMAITRATGKAYRLAFAWIIQLAGYEGTPAEEMDGVIDGEVAPVRKPAAKPKQSSNGGGNWPDRPWDAETLKRAMLAKAGDSTQVSSDRQQAAVRASMGRALKNNDDHRRLITDYLYGVQSSKDLTTGQASAIIDWIGSTKDNDYTPNPESVEEAKRVVAANLEEHGAPTEPSAGYYG